RRSWCLLSGRAEPFGQHRLMLHRVELDDLVKAHQPGLAERFVREKFVQLLAGFRASDQNAAGRRNARPAQEKTALVVTALQETAMFRDQIRVTLLEGNEVLSFQEEISH